MTRRAHTQKTTTTRIKSRTDGEDTMKKLAAIALGIALAGTATVALAGRNSSGTYSLPSGNPVVSGTSISSTWANNTLGDLASEVTNSLDRSGRGGMLAPIRVPNGSAGAPTLSFSNETGSGWYRAGAGDVRLAITGTDRCTVTSSGLTVAGGLTLSGALSVTGKATSAATVSGDGSTTLATKGYVDGSILKTGAAVDLGTTDSNEIHFLTNNALVAAFQVTGDLWVGSHKVKAVATPTASDDAATKGYVDGRPGLVRSTMLVLANPATSITWSGWTEPDTNYRIVVTPTAWNGVSVPPDASRVNYASKGTSSVTVYLQSAPGAGNTVTFDLLMFR